MEGVANIFKGNVERQNKNTEAARASAVALDRAEMDTTAALKHRLSVPSSFLSSTTYISKPSMNGILTWPKPLKNSYAFPYDFPG